MNEVFNTEVFLKLEFLQNSGTFKTRGAINNILNIDKKILNKGINDICRGTTREAIIKASKVSLPKNFIQDSAYAKKEHIINGIIVDGIATVNVFKKA